MGMPLSSRTWSTPTWAMPKAAPPPTARPTLAPRIFRASRCSGGDAGDRRLARTCSARATGSRSRRAGSSGITNGSQWLIGRACDAPLCRLTTSKILRRAGAARVDTRPGASTTSTTTSDTSLAARTQGSAIPPRSNTRNAKRSPSVAMSLVTLSAWLCSSPFAPTLARRRAAWPSAPSTPRTRSGDMRESSVSVGDSCRPVRPAAARTTSASRPVKSRSRAASADATSDRPRSPGRLVTVIAVVLRSATSPRAMVASRWQSSREKYSSTLGFGSRKRSKADRSSASRRALRATVTVAARVPPCSSDISPSTSPGPSRLITRPSPPRTSSSPLSTTNRASPFSPSRHTVSPLW